MTSTERKGGQKRRTAQLAGTGAMSALVNAMDWALTPLGRADTWPTSLRTTVGIVLASRFPMALWWGKDLRNLYNDAYVPILGDKHPASLGAPAREVWSEIWHILGPQAEGVIGGAPATWNEHLLLLMNRRGFLEETYFTFSYSPVPNDVGAVGGVLVTCQETTAQVQDERQLRTLRELAARSGDANSAEGACKAAARILAANDADVPFALLFLVEDGRVELARAAGFDGTPQGYTPAARCWPLDQAGRHGKAVLVDDLLRRVGTLPGGRWNSPPTAALCVPLVRQGQPPFGFLVAGISPRRMLDEGYRGFFLLAADHLAGAIANARTFQEERRRAEMLAKLDRAKTTFFTNVSHEFRTPLTLLLGPLEEVLQDETLAAHVRERLTLAHRNGVRLLKLSGAMLDFSRIEAGRMTATYEATDLAAATTDLASAFRSACEHAGLRLVVDCPPLDEPVYVDRDLWEKIVLNLLSNAFKFTLEGEIQVRLRRSAGFAELVVQDTGVGIPAEEQSRVFERFHRAEHTRGRSFEGTGIGLALVLELVKLHGGEITVHSEVDRGTTFTVLIPLGRAHLPPGQLREPKAPTPPTHLAPYLEEALRWLPEAVDTVPGPNAAAPPRGRILLADDNADMRAYLGRLLGERWDVEAVGNGREALAAVQRRPPDLLVTDVMMPELDGYGLLAALRADERTRELPVLMVSAQAGEEARVEGLQAGANDYLVKPFSARELAARVEALYLRERLRVVEARQARRMARVFAQAPVGIALLRGPEHVYELANPNYLDIVGRRPLLGMPIREALPELEGQGIYELLDRVFASGEPFVGRAIHVVLVRKPDREPEECVFDFVYQPLLDETGHVEGIAIVTFEVTALAQARREADAANQAKDEFLAMLGHELRNPLSPIVTALHLMQMRGIPGHERERAIIERQVRHLVGLVDDLLDISRITRGKIELRRQNVELADVVAQAIEVASPLLEQHRHNLHTAVPGGLVVHADPGRLAQVITNLLTNAAKYMAPGGQVTVMAERADSAIVLRVRDHGIGIEPSLLPHIFEPFTQARQTLERSQGGLGLGLAIVRNIVNLHGGSVAAASGGLGHGTEFTVTLPDPGQTAADVRPPVPQATPRPGARRVLVVDDNEDAARALAEALELLGHHVRHALDGPQAIRIFEVFKPEVALLDIGLPVMDGYELAGRLVEGARPGHIALVAVTGYGQQQDLDRSADAGFCAHLVKPVDLDQLRRTLDAIA